MIPWELIKRGIEASHPFSVFTVRSMLAVPFFEKAVYELPEEQVTPEAVTALADSLEKDVEGGLAGRYCLCLPATPPPSAYHLCHCFTPTLPCLALHVRLSLLILFSNQYRPKFCCSIIYRRGDRHASQLEMPSCSWSCC